MNDAVATAINSSIMAQGYRTKIATEGNTRKWDTIPLVCIVPETSPKIEFLFKRVRHIVYKYNLIYVDSNDLNTTVTDPFINFKLNMAKLFEGGFSYAENVDGVTNCEITDNEYYKKELLPLGYSYSIMSVTVDRIIDIFGTI